MSDVTELKPTGSLSILDKIISEQQASHIQQFKPAEVLNKLLESLSERERQILWRRFAFSGGKVDTLENIGQFFKVTRERIRQIERSSIHKLRQLSHSQDMAYHLRQVIVEEMEAEGGIVPATRFQRHLLEMSNEAKPETINFILDELFVDLIERLGGENTELCSGWRLRNASLEMLQQLIDKAQDIISTVGKVLPGEELANQLAVANLTAPLGGTLQDTKQIIKLLGLSRRVRCNPFGEWGLAHWETISPRRMNDKIYLVLKKAGKPLHFREIVRLINGQHFDNKVAYPPTIHNELILDKKYVLVGRGIYGLSEWGYKPGVVADVLVDILRQAGQPLTADELVEKVLTQRIVKRGTILLALTNHQRFHRLADGRYTLVNKAVSGAEFESSQPS